MSDEIKDEVVLENPTVEEPENKPESEKRFTQAEVDKLLGDRVARANKKLEKFADYDELKTKASEYENAIEEKRLAELSAQERAEELAKKFEAERNDFAKQLEEFKTKAERQQILNAFIKAAPGVNIPSDRIDAAMKLADLAAVTVGEDGEVSGIDELMNTLVSNYTFLAEVKKPQKPIGEASNGNVDVSEKTSEQLLRDAQDKAKRSGRIEDRMAVAALKRELNL
jgi:hypothetical protein